MFVSFNANARTVELFVEQEYKGCAIDTDGLLELLVKNNVTGSDDLFNSSSIDFASEYGFATDDDAHAIIDGALAQL